MTIKPITVPIEYNPTRILKLSTCGRFDLNKTNKPTPAPVQRPAKTDPKLIMPSMYNSVNKIDETQFGMNEVKLLGVTINGQRQMPSEIKKAEALEYPQPENIPELRRFLGLTGWFRQFIKDYARKTVHLTSGLRQTGKEWKWTEEMSIEFDGIKRELQEMKGLLLAN